MRRLKRSGDEGIAPAVMSWRSEEGEIIIRLFLRHRPFSTICIAYRKIQRAVYKLSMGTCKQLVGLDEGGLGVYQCSVGLFDAFRKVFSQLTIEEFHATLLCVADAANNVCLQADDLLHGRLNFRR